MTDLYLGNFFRTNIQLGQDHTWDPILFILDSESRDDINKPTNGAY